MTDNRCIFCGAVIPEGRQVCPSCEKNLTGEDTKGSSCGLLEEDD